MSVAILGSLNMDVVFSCDILPEAGETILCSSVTSGPGGKGLNQAVAARRAGSDVELAGAVGSDPNGDALLSFLRNEGIDTARIARLGDTPTGLAHIMVDRRGENAIIVASGANKSAMTSSPTAAPSRAPVFLTQLENELDAVTAFLNQGRMTGARTILNAAPAIAEASKLFPLADVLIVNEHELARFSGQACGEQEAITRAARAVISRTDQILIITLGAQGTQIVSAGTSERIPAYPVDAIDTTGAGDCFCGVFAAEIAAGAPVADAVRKANRAASLAVQKMGAASAMPVKAEIDRA